MSMKISKFLDPFSIPAQMNNLGILVVAYVANDIHQSTECEDPSHQHFLYFILYGSMIVCGGTFILTVLYLIGVIDFCINKICPCGQVCLTLNTLGIFLAGIIYHCIATIYGIVRLLFSDVSNCIELEMFKRIAGIIYLIWMMGIACFLVFLMYRSRLRAGLALQEPFVNA